MHNLVTICGGVNSNRLVCYATVTVVVSMPAQLSQYSITLQSLDRHEELAIT